MSKEYPILGSPIQINGVTMKNRFITTSMSPGMGYVDGENHPTQMLANYLEERAEGGTGMIIQTICPWKRTNIEGLHPLPCAYDDSCIDELKTYMVDPVHKHDGLISAPRSTACTTGSRNATRRKAPGAPPTSPSSP